MIPAKSVLVPLDARRGGTSTDQAEKHMSAASQEAALGEMVCLWTVVGLHERHGGA